MMHSSAVKSVSVPNQAYPKPKVLFLLEGNADIRILRGLAEICDLQLVVPEKNYVTSQLQGRLEKENLNIGVQVLKGGRLQYQLRSLLKLAQMAGQYDVILTQELLRGCLNANIAGRLRGIPVVTYLGIPAVEYFSCRRARHQISLLRHLMGLGLIKFLLKVNGLLVNVCLSAGPYLHKIALRDCPKSRIAQFYGVDTERFFPSLPEERTALRQKWNLPTEKFLIFLSSRMTHEKDPETALLAVNELRKQGLDAMLVNLAGDYQKFIELSRKMNLDQPEDWVVGKPAVHPIYEVADFFRMADVVVMSSIQEGACLSTLEALSSTTPLVATKVGGMAVQLKGFARLVPPGNPTEMAEQLHWIYNHPSEARKQASKGRIYVEREWNQKLAFESFQRAFQEVCRYQKQN